MAEMKVYHVGYSSPNSEQLLQSLMQDPAMLIIDTRKTPWSWRSAWCRDDKVVGTHVIPGLRSQWGDRYRYAGHYLGNLNYKHPGAPIKIANIETGLRGLRMYLQEGLSLILLCGCSDVESCHRLVIMRALQAAMPGVQFYSADGKPELALAS